MKLYAIIYFFGKVAASVGPWIDSEYDPYREQIEEKCNEAVAELLYNADVLYKDNPVQFDDAGRATTRNDITAMCEWRKETPKLNSLKPTK